MVDSNALADVVVMAIKAAMAPVQAQLATLQERCAGYEARLAALPSSDVAVTELRERVVTLEAKAAMPTVEPPTVDGVALLAPVQVQLAALTERVSGFEGRVSSLPSSDAAVTELRERVVAVEVKSALPVPEPPAVDTAGVLAPVLEQVSGLRERLGVLETKSDQLPAQVVTAEPDASLVDLRARVGVLEAKHQCDTLPQDVAGIRERIAVLETRAPVPGPAGADGKDGLHGKDGADGLGFEDLAVEFDHDRTLTLTFQRGLQKKSFPVTLPYLKHQGIYQDGATYEPGDVVTWAGSQWHCSEPTNAKPGEGTKAWTLIVKRGRDGKDGRDAPGALPVVSLVGRSK